jgi:hypothetical protein
VPAYRSHITVIMMPRCKSMTIGVVIQACRRTVCGESPKPSKHEVTIVNGLSLVASVTAAAASE